MNGKITACIDAGSGEKLEQWKGIVLSRPDPQAIWPADTRTGDLEKSGRGIPPLKQRRRQLGV